MQLTFRFALFVLVLVFPLFSCEKDAPQPSVEAPASYAFERNGTNTVAFPGQTERLLMGGELSSALLDFTRTEELLLEMYTNEKAGGGDANPFSNPELNASSKSIRSKVAASSDYFATNTVASIAIKDQIAGWLTAQVSEVFPSENVAASPGQAGQVADGTSVRYVNAQGLEYNQMVIKSLIGALAADQMLNNYLSPAVLDAGNNRADNDADVTVAGEAYTEMEHKWDEAYGYLFGGSPDAAAPLATLGADDEFLNKYLGRVENDDDFAGIAQDIYDAFKLGRAAIVAKDYELRDLQADIIREKISIIIGVRAVYYLQTGKKAMTTNQGGAFHDLSEGYGFIYSLQFTRKPGTDQPYLDADTVQGLLDELLGDGPNGLWDVTPATLDAISNTIADAFPFTLAEAAE